ncbi:type II secretion system F family protein, partial [Streptomyces lavendulocolor]
VVALAMGWALGADPLRVLFHTPGGLCCLAVGGLLEAVGLWWAGRVVRAGEAP